MAGPEAGPGPVWGSPTGPQAGHAEAEESVPGPQEPRLTARQLQTLLDNSPDLIGRYDRDGRRLFVNRAIAQLFDRTPQELVGTRVGGPASGPEGAVLPPDGAGRLLDAFRSAYDDGEPVELEVTYQVPDRPIVVQYRVVPEFGSDGAVADVLAIGRDITAVKRIEQELAASRQLYLDVFDNALDQMILLEVCPGGRFRILAVNRAMETAMRRPRAEVVGRFQDELYHGEVDRLLSACYQACIDAGAPLEGELDLPLAAGRRIYQATTVPTRDETGRIVRVVNIVRDITERRQVEVQQDRLNRALKTLSSGNETLIRAVDEASLLSGMCRVMVEVGGYRRAWIGYADQPPVPEAAAPGMSADDRVDSESLAPQDGAPTSDDPEDMATPEDRAPHQGAPTGIEAQDLQVPQALVPEGLEPRGVRPQGVERLEGIVLQGVEGRTPVIPMAWACQDDAESEAAQPDPGWVGSDGPLREAVRTGRPQLSRLRDGDVPPGAAAEPLGCDVGACLTLPLQHDGRMIGVFVVQSAQADAFEPDELRLLGELADDLAYGIHNLRTRGAQEQHEERLRRAMSATIQALADTTELRDPYTAGHQRRVAQLARAVGRRMGLPEDQVAGLYLASTIHDIGKICVPAEILGRPGKLSPLEYAMVQQHVTAAYELLKGIEFPWPVADIVGQHHERFDGSGYPNGLRGDEQLPEARILAACDVVEAMSSHRPYRPGLGMEAALAELRAGRGTLYDPAVVDACVWLIRKGQFAFE